MNKLPNSSAAAEKNSRIASQPSAADDPASFLSVVTTAADTHLKDQEIPVKDQEVSDLKKAYDLMESEYLKDVWDMRNLPGVRRNITNGHYKITFLPVPPAFQQAVKQYTRYNLTRHSAHYATGTVMFLANFLKLYHALHPEAEDLSNMNRADVEAFLVQVRAHVYGKGRPASDGWKLFSVMHIENWIDHMQRTSDPFAPKVMASRLFWPGDMGRCKTRRNQTEIKYIPEFVLRQVDEHLHEFMPIAYRPVALLLRASGWRISDILSLRLDTCLVQTGEKWWLQGDITKTNVLGHRVPITEEIAKIVLTQRTLVRQHFSQEQNRLQLLFPATSSQRQGDSLSGGLFARWLKKFVAVHNICNEHGELHPFSPHAFRHTKAVELINNGMPLVVVQKWLAHASPEMTLVYANILGETLRSHWEDAMRRGALRNAEDGTPTMFNPLEKDAGEIEWEYIRSNLDSVRLTNGFCFKPKTIDCPTQAIPCHTCHHFCTTPDFLPQFRAQREGVLIQIQLGKAQNRKNTVDRNEQLLEPIDKIIETLEGSEVHHPAGKLVREYTAEEMQKRREKLDKAGKEAA